MGLDPVFAQSPTTLVGTVASQPNAPAKIQSCTATVTGATFTPQISFDPAASVKTSTVTYAFFSKENAALGHVSLTAPYAPTALPANTATFTCAIANEELADGTVFPAASHPNTALVVGGVAGVAVIAALAFHSGSGSSGPSPTQAPVTPTPSPTPTVSPTSSASVTPSPSPIATATSTATATATPTGTPTPTASPVGPLTLTPNVLNFNSDGSTSTAQLNENMYTGTLKETSTTCGSGGTVDNGPVASISPALGSTLSDPQTLTVTSDESGTCTATFVDNNSPPNSVTLTINVTTSSVVIDRHRRATPRSTPEPQAGRGPRKV
jgi:hypothetical protein